MQKKKSRVKILGETYFIEIGVDEERGIVIVQEDPMIRPRLLTKAKAKCNLACDKFSKAKGIKIAISRYKQKILRRLCRDFSSLHNYYQNEAFRVSKELFR